MWKFCAWMSIVGLVMISQIGAAAVKMQMEAVYSLQVSPVRFFSWPFIDDFNVYSAHLCQLPAFHCKIVHRDDTWTKRWPKVREREIMMRLNRTNVPLNFRQWVLVPRDLSHVHYMALSPLSQRIERTGHQRLIIDLRVFAFGAYNKKGDLIYWGPASTGGASYYGKQDRCHRKMSDWGVTLMQSQHCLLSRSGMRHRDISHMSGTISLIKGARLLGFINRGHRFVKFFYSDAKWLNQSFIDRKTDIKVRC